ncbi:MAG: hypothetical protein ACTSU5_17670, partial [Promethearchaeota archaeon]
APSALPGAPVLQWPSDPGAGGDVVLNWAPVDGATSYRVYRATKEFTALDGGQLVVGSTGRSTNYTDPGLADGTYYYCVTALNASGESAGSNVVNVTVVGHSSPWEALGLYLSDNWLPVLLVGVAVIVPVATASWILGNRRGQRKYGSKPAGSG